MLRVVPGPAPSDSPAGGRTARGPRRVITLGEIAEWREALAWSEGEALDPATVADLLDEVERLHGELAAAHRRLSVRALDPHGVVDCCECTICRAAEAMAASTRLRTIAPDAEP